MDCPTFFVARSHVGIHNPLCQYPRLAHVTRMCLGVRCERKSPVLVIGRTGKPLLLFRHRRSVRSEKGKSIESTVECPIIHCSRLPVADNLPCLVEALQ